jgi:pre-mRNA-splicing factor CWC22
VQGGSEEEEEAAAAAPATTKPGDRVEIHDMTETDLVALRRTIYLTLKSSLDFEEAAHKLMKMTYKPGQEVG